MTGPSHPAAGHSVDRSTVEGHGSGITAGIVGRDVHQGDVYRTTNNHVYVNGHPYDRAMIDARVNALTTDHPARVYATLGKEDDERYRRLLLRSLPAAFGARVVKAMTQLPDGLLDCARHYLGPMDSEHAIPLLEALTLADQAEVIARMERQDARHLILALADQPEHTPRAAHLIAAIAALAPPWGGPGTAAAILPSDPGILSLLPAEPAIAQLLAAWDGDIGEAFDALDAKTVRSHVALIAERDPSVVSGLLARPDVHPGVLSWVGGARRKELGPVLAHLLPDQTIRLLSDLAPMKAAKVLAFAPPRGWLARIERSRAAAILDVLTELAPQAAAVELRRYPPAVGADIIGLMTSERARALLRELPWSLAVVMLSELSRSEPGRADRLLDSVKDGRPELGTWPAWFAARATIAAASPPRAGAQAEMQPSQAVRHGLALFKQWLVVRRAVARWTKDLRPRRRRDAAFTGAGAGLTALAALLLGLSGSSPTTTSPRAAAPVATVPRFPPDLAIMADKTRWTAQECPGWSEQTEIREADRVVMLRLVCTLQDNAPAVQLAYLQYPSDALAFVNRPTTEHPVPSGSPGATVHQILTPAIHPDDPPTWSTDGGRHGIFYEYLPDRHKSAIWMEEEGTPARAMVLFGPDPSGRSEAQLRELFAKLREILARHGYELGR